MNRFDDKFHGFDPTNSDDIVMQVQRSDQICCTRTL